MNLPNIPLALRHGRILLKENGPLVGAVAAGVGFTGAIGLTVKATVQAIRKTDYEAEKKGEALTVGETVKSSIRFYIPALLLWLGSIVSLCFSIKGYSKSVKSLATLYAASQAAKKELEQAAIEKFGEKQYGAMQDEVAKKRMETDPVDQKPVYEVGCGESLCYDTLSGRYFRASRDRVERGLNAFNKRLLIQEALNYNELMYEISKGKLEDIGFGDDVGWNIKNGLLELRYSSQLAKNGEPCLVLQYPEPPVRRYEY